MYNAQTVINRIQSLIKEQGLTQKNVLAECGISENTLKRMTDNKGMSSFYLARIADRLNCSVDYLLGRTDNPDDFSAELKEIQRILESLSVREKTELMTLIYEFADKKLMIHA